MSKLIPIISGSIILSLASCVAPETVEDASSAAPIVAAVETVSEATPAENYATYCALCHGDDREGYRNDSAPSLKTASLFSVSDYPVVLSTAYGRPGTPMGPYLDDMGGPLSMSQIHDLVLWLAAEAGQETSRPSVEMLKPIPGDTAAGMDVYEQNCAMCHGTSGEGHGSEGPGTALGNATMLATQPDLFLKNAIVDGREGTPMPSFASMLSETEIDDVVAFLRSRAGGWNVEDMTYEEPPSLENIILNAEGAAPEFELSEGRYIDSTQLNAALEAGNRMILIDTRVPYFWAMAHIKGSLPVPYYSSRDEFIEKVPNDGTWIVAYCECPRAAADSTVNKLRELGYPNTAVLYEGYAGWSAQGFPVSVGKVE